MTTAELVADARFQVIRRDVPGVDWSVVAHHGNPYVRAAALDRLRPEVGALNQAQLRRVLSLLTDSAPIYSPECVDWDTPTDLVSGAFDAWRGSCLEQARSVGAFADDVVAAAPPERVAEAWVAHLAGPPDAVLGLAPDLSESGLSKRRLRAVAARSAHVLIPSATAALARADSRGRDALLAALTAAPPGSGNGEVIDAVIALQTSDVRWTATLAAAAVIVLTDAPGDAPAPVDREPRRTAVRLLREALLRSFAELALIRDLGPSAAPLLDSVIERMQMAQSNPLYAGEAQRMAGVVQAMGTRGRRATPALFALGAMLAAQTSGDGEPQGITQVIDALAAVGAPSNDLTRLLVAHATSAESLRSGARALAAAHAAVDPADLAVLRQRMDPGCSSARFVRTPMPPVCTEAFAALDALEGVKRAVVPPDGGEP